MRPDLTQSNKTNGTQTNAVLGSNFAEQATLGAHTQDVAHLFLGQFGHTVSFTARTQGGVTPSGATFGNHVLCVVVGGAQEQMSRVAAGWVVTFVEHPQTFGDWTNQQLVCNAGCSRKSSTTPTATNTAVAAATCIARPTPTAIGVIRPNDLHPKPFCEVGFRHMVMQITKGLALDNAIALVVALGHARGLAAAALAKVRAVERQLDRGIRGWYTRHVIDLLNRLMTTPRPVSAGAGAFHA